MKQRLGIVSSQHAESSVINIIEVGIVVRAALIKIVPFSFFFKIVPVAGSNLVEENIYKGLPAIKTRCIHSNRTERQMISIKRSWQCRKGQ
jgi:hypothetical protein